MASCMGEEPSGEYFLDEMILKSIDKYTHRVYRKVRVMKMNIREMRTLLGETQSEFSERYHIPFRTVQNWETGTRTPPEYMLELLESRIRSDLMNRKTAALPKYNSQKIDFDGIFVIPEYQERFEKLAAEAIEYYAN